ncbi:hypothetical protein DSECCO2_428970 [anaerobic digester metagenome]
MSIRVIPEATDSQFVEFGIGDSGYSAIIQHYATRAVHYSNPFSREVLQVHCLDPITLCAASGAGIAHADIGEQCGIAYEALLGIRQVHTHLIVVDDDVLRGKGNVGTDLYPCIGIAWGLFRGFSHDLDVFQLSV